MKLNLSYLQIFSGYKPVKMRVLFLILFLLFSLSFFAQSEHNNFFKLDIYNGLSHNQVNAIVKDADGFLWFGTRKCQQVYTT